MPYPTAYQIFTVCFTVDPNNPNNKEIEIRVGLQLLVSGFMEIMNNKIMFTTRIHFLRAFFMLKCGCRWANRNKKRRFK